MKGPYQEFDPLTPEEFAALEQDILLRGVQVAVVFDEHGNVLDGHHRLAICEKHGITNYPSAVKSGLTDDEKRDYAQSLNMARRSLTREQRQKQIRNRITRNPEHSDRMIAQALGVDHKTVGRARKKLESSGELPRPERKVGINGMRYKTPAKPKVTDANGGEVPQRLENVFRRRGEHVALVNLIAELKRRANEAANLTPLNTQLEVVQRHLKAAEDAIRETSPHAIHSDCGGKGCRGCGNKGFLTAGEVPH